MIATSFGLGPFKPAIRWYDRLWVCSSVEFENEDEAANAADGVVTYLNSKAVDYLNGLHYDPMSRIGKE